MAAMPIMPRRLAVALTCVLACVSARLDAQWPQFRGPNGSGIGDGAGYPTEFSPMTNVAWKTAVPFGQSSPVIAGTRLYLTGLLTRWGYKVVAVDDGKRAHELLACEDSPSLALLDWMMPGMDGVEICRRLRGRVRGRPLYLLLLTGRTGQDNVVHGLESGADDYVTKPFDHAELRSRLRVGERVLDMSCQLQDRVAELVQALGRVKQLEAMVAAGVPQS